MTIQLMLGDCLERMKEISDGSVDMVMCDLPYGTTQNKWDAIIPFEALWREYKRVCNGAVVLMSQGPFTAQTIMSNLPDFRYKLVWEKSKPTNFLNVKRQPLRKHEDICVFYASQPTYNPQMSPGKPYSKGVRKNALTGAYGDFKPVLVASEGARHPTDIIYFKTAESEGPVVHGTQKPVALMRYLIETYSNDGDLVLDNAMGSGTTGVACVNTGRNFIGIERDPEYFTIAERRITDAQGIFA